MFIQALKHKKVELRGIKLLQNMASEFHTSPFLTIMALETTDASNQEPVTLFVRWPNDELQGHEYYIHCQENPSTGHVLKKAINSCRYIYN